MLKKPHDKTDSNQKGIVKELRKMGLSVQTGHDDILVGLSLRVQTFWFEIKSKDCVSRKTGKIKPSSLKDSQKELLKSFKGQYDIVATVGEIIYRLNGNAGSIDDYRLQRIKNGLYFD